MDKSEIEEKRQELSHRVFIHMLEILAIFGIPAVGAYFAGSWLDRTYDIYPYGSIISGAVALIISWSITIRIYKKIKRRYSELEEKQKEVENNSN
ncbi:MAG: hypothetical protein ABEJ24_05160 [Candidatus Magasanikbacteria bacterium]